MFKFIFTIYNNIKRYKFSIFYYMFDIKENSALLVIDLQNDFYLDGTIPIIKDKTFIENVNLIIEQFIKKNKKIIFTKDWHPIDHVSFKKWPIHCIQNSKGAKIISTINQSKIDLLIEKGIDKNIENYSAFFISDDSSGLKEFLFKQNIENLYIIGVVAEYCIKFTVIDAISMGFNVYLLQKGIISEEKDFDLVNISSKVNII